MNPIAPKTSPSTSLISLNGELGTEVTTAEQKKNQHKNIKVKLCDFSFSQVMVPGKPILGMMGTVAYSGNQQQTKNYDKTSIRMCSFNYCLFYFINLECSS